MPIDEPTLNPCGNEPKPIAPLRADLYFELQPLGGQTGYVCRDPARGEYFRFGQREFEIASLFDGKRCVEDVVEIAHSAAIECDVETVNRLVHWLTHNSLLQSSIQPQVASLPSGNAWMQGIGKAVSIRVPLVDADPIARSLTHSLGLLYTRAGFLVWLVVGLAALATISVRWDQFLRDMRSVFDPSSWIWLATVWCVVKVLHEVGHAVAARRQGVVVGRGGIIMLLFAPIAYVDVTDGWRLPRAWSRIQIALGGVYVELFLASIAVFLWATTSSPLLSNLAANVILAAGPATLLVNVNPLMRLDGYFALSDLVRIPNLAMHGNRQLSGYAEWVLLGRRRPDSMLVGWRRPFATVHAIASLIYKAVWIIGLLLLVSTYFSGFGVIPAVIAFGLWVLVPLARWASKLLKADDRGAALRRLGESCLAFTLLVVATMYVRSPVGQSVPVVVTHKDQQALRSPTSGFVEQLCVASGERVEAGQLLMRIKNDDLELEHHSLELDIQASRIRHRQLVRQDKRGMAQGEKEHLNSLIARELELRSELEEQQLRAATAGIVLTPNIERRIGTFVNQGDVLVEVGHPGHKELVASIAQNQVANFQVASSQKQASSVRIWGGGRLKVRLEGSDPRGSTNLPHPALAAMAGGTVPVTANDETGDLQMTETRFEATIPIAENAAAELQSGQRGTLELKDQRTIYELVRERLIGYWDQAVATLRAIA